MNTQVTALAGRLTSLKKIALTSAVGAVLGLSSLSASAVEATFTGFTNGCFGLACVPVSSNADQTIIPRAGPDLQQFHLRRHDVGRIPLAGIHRRSHSGRELQQPGLLHAQRRSRQLQRQRLRPAGHLLGAGRHQPESGPLHRHDLRLGHGQQPGRRLHQFRQHAPDVHLRRRHLQLLRQRRLAQPRQDDRSLGHYLCASVGSSRARDLCACSSRVWPR